MERMFSIEPHVRSMIDKDGAVLLDLKAGKYFSLNGIAAAVWTRVEQGSGTQKVLDELTDLYKVDRTELENDLQEMIEGLAQKGLVRVDA